ncbi:MAG: hypothetical protein AAGA48_11390 [Myxococcota bacterium]
MDPTHGRKRLGYGLEHRDGLRRREAPAREDLGGNHLPGVGPDGRHQVAGAVADVVVLNPSHLARRGRSPGVGRAKGLDVRLLVEADHHFVRGKVSHVQVADGVATWDVVGPVRRREQVVALSVRLNLGRRQDALHRGAAHHRALKCSQLDDQRLSHPHVATVVLVRLLATEADDHSLVTSGSSPRTARALGIAKRLQTRTVPKARRPFANRRPADAAPPSRLAHRHPHEDVPQHDLRSLHAAMLCAPLAHHRFQLGSPRTPIHDCSSIYGGA